MNAKGIVAGIIAGACGAAIWAAIAYYAGVEVGYVAWGIGGLVGIAVSAAGNSPGPSAGIMAVVITILALVAGKYASIELVMRKELAEVMAEEVDLSPDSFEEPALIAELANGIVERREAAGTDVPMPELVLEDEEIEAKDQFPPDIWDEATAEWNAMDSDQQQELRERVAEETKQIMEQLAGAFLASVRQDAFKESFGVLDLVFFGLAIFTAWSVASGGGSEE